MSAIRKKTRAEAFENSLTPEQLSQLYVWCGRSFKVAQANALQEWGLKVGVKSLHRWFHKDDDLKVLSFIASGAAMNQKIENAYQKNPEPAVETLVKLCKTLVMQLSVQGATDPDKLKAANFLMGNVLEFLKIQEKAKDRAFNETKFKESLKTKLQSGLDAVAEAFKNNPDAMQFYTRARSMIERETT